MSSRASSPRRQAGDLGGVGLSQSEGEFLQGCWGAEDSEHYLGVPGDTGIWPLDPKVTEAAQRGVVADERVSDVGSHTRLVSSSSTWACDMAWSSYSVASSPQTSLMPPFPSTVSSQSPRTA